MNVVKTDECLNKSSLSQMPKKNCPECHKRLRLFQIGWEEAVELCENDKCLYPIISSTAAELIIKRSVDDVPIQRKKHKRPAGRKTTTSSISNTASETTNEKNNFQSSVLNSSTTTDPLSADFDFLLNGINSSQVDCEVNSELTELMSLLNNYASNSGPDDCNNTVDGTVPNISEHKDPPVSEKECHNIIENDVTSYQLCSDVQTSRKSTFQNNIQYKHNAALPVKNNFSEVCEIVNYDSDVNIADASNVSASLMKTVQNTELEGLVPGGPSLVRLTNVESVSSTCAEVHMVNDSIIDKQGSQTRVSKLQGAHLKDTDTINMCSKIWKEVHISNDYSYSNLQVPQNQHTLVLSSSPTVLIEQKHPKTCEQVNSSSRGPVRLLTLEQETTILHTYSRKQKWTKTTMEADLRSTTEGDESCSANKKPRKATSPKNQKDNANSPNESELLEQQVLTESPVNDKSLLSIVTVAQRTRSKPRTHCTNTPTTCCTKTPTTRCTKTSLVQPAKNIKTENVSDPVLIEPPLSILNCLDIALIMPVTNSKSKKTMPRKKRESSTLESSQQFSKLNSVNCNVSKWLGNKLQKTQFPGYKFSQKKVHDGGSISEDSGIQSPSSSKSDESVESRIIRCQ